MKQYKSHNSNEGVHSLEAIISKKKKNKRVKSKEKAITCPSFKLH